jgi:hypothetical protein
MTPTTTRPTAKDLDDLGRYFAERTRAGDVDGLVALYEPNAVLTFQDGTIATGHREIRTIYENLVATAHELPPGRPRPPLLSDNLALTATELPTGAVTVKIAHRQPEGHWLWAVDQPPFTLPTNPT